MNEPTSICYQNQNGAPLKSLLGFIASTPVHTSKSSNVFDNESIISSEIHSVPGTPSRPTPKQNVAARRLCHSVFAVKNNLNEIFCSQSDKETTPITNSRQLLMTLDENQPSLAAPFYNSRSTNKSIGHSFIDTAHEVLEGNESRQEIQSPMLSYVLRNRVCIRRKRPIFSRSKSKSINSDRSNSLQNNSNSTESAEANAQSLVQSIANNQKENEEDDLCVNMPFVTIIDELKEDSLNGSVHVDVAPTSVINVSSATLSDHSTKSTSNHSPKPNIAPKVEFGCNDSVHEVTAGSETINQTNTSPLVIKPGKWRHTIYQMRKAKQSNSKLKA